MELEQVTNPAETKVEEEVAAEVTETTETPEPEQLEADEADGEEQEPEFEEVEINGNRYKVPKEIAPAIMKNADYTQKTQALAEEKRQWEARISEDRESIQREAEMFEAMQDEIANVRAVDARLQSLQQVNPYTLSPADQQRYTLELMQLQNAKQDLTGRIQNRRSELEAEREQKSANAISKAIEILTKPDERLGWSGKYDDQMRTSLTNFGRELGFSDAEMARETRPNAIKLLHLAKLGFETLNKQRAAIVKPKVEAKPVPQVSRSNAKGVTDPDRLSMEDWVKYEQRRMAKARAR